MTTHGRSMTVIAAFVGPLLLLATTVAYIVNGQGFSEGEVPGAIQIWAFILYGVAIVGLARLLDIPAPRAAAVITLVAIIGTAGGAAYGIDAIGLAVLDGTIVDSPVAPFALRIPGLAFPAALLTLGLLLARHRCVPITAGYALTFSALLFPIAHIGDLMGVALVSDVIGIVAMGAIALSLSTAANPVAVSPARP